MNKTIVPIFIISLPRSGSTLLQNILSNNSEISTTSEPWILIPLISFYKGDYKSKTNPHLAKEAVSDFLKTATGKKTNDIISDLVSSLYQKASNDGTKYFLDKTPRYYEYIDEIVQLFPEAKVIILKRDLCDVLSSISHTWKIDDFNKLRAFKRDLLDGPKIIQDFQERNTNNPNVRTVFYEDIIQNAEKEIKDLYDWLDIDFNTNYLNFSNNNKTQGRFGDSTGVKVHKEPIKTKVERAILNDPYWRKFTIGYLNFLGKDFLGRYGYCNYPSTKKTNDFSYFIYSCYSKRTSTKTALLNAYKNLKYRLTCKKFDSNSLLNNIDILP